MKQYNYSSGFRILSLIILILVSGIISKGQPGNSTAKPGGMKIYPYAFPLRVSSGNRYLVDQNNQPFFWSGEAAWSLIAQLSKQDVAANFYGDSPFSGKLFVSPNEKYFAHADYVIKAASLRNIVVLLAPLYLGYDCKDEGWCAEVKTASLTDLRSWQTLIPDFENHIITSGYGKWGSKDYVASTRTSDGNTKIAYLPSKRTVTIDMSKIHGAKAKCWWYNPCNGKSEVGGTYNNSGFRSFNPNSEGDRVLVIDNDSMKLTAPGSQILIKPFRN